MNMLLVALHVTTCRNLYQTLGYSIDANKSYWILLEYVNGQALDDFLSHRRHTLQLSNLLHIAIQVLYGLRQIHQLHYVHMDMKMNNCMIEEDANHGFHVKVIDYDLAQPQNTTLRCWRTDDRLAKGWWLPPEICPARTTTGKLHTSQQKFTVKPSIDIYCFYWILMDLLCGAETAAKVARQSIRDVSNFPTYFTGFLSSLRQSGMVTQADILESLQLSIHHDPCLRPSADGLIDILEKFKNKVDLAHMPQ